MQYSDWKQEGHSRFLLYCFLSSLVICMIQPMVGIRHVGFLGQLDEGLCVLVLIYGLFHHVLSLKEFMWFCGIMLFYFVYSMMWGVNTWQGTLYGFLFYLKPFVCFYVAYKSGFRVSRKLRRKAKTFILLLSMVVIYIALNVSVFYSNIASFYPVCLFLVISYFYLCEKPKERMLFAAVFLSLGMLSLKAKYITECVIFVYIFFFLKGKITLNIKYLLLFAILIAISIYFNREKFYTYFVNADIETTARSALYYYSYQGFQDYFPFGSGFGTYGTEAAAKYYSPLYQKYGLDMIWGMRQVDYSTSSDFLKDTYFPTLVEVGFVGAILYILFWIRRFRLLSKLEEFNRYKLGVFVILCINIENIANLSFMLGNYCIPAFLLLGELSSTSTRNE